MRHWDGELHSYTKKGRCEHYAYLDQTDLLIFYAGLRLFAALEKQQ
jgi:hypothetical protein